MPKEKKDDANEMIIDQLTANTKELLNDYYARAESLQQKADSIKITIAHEVAYRNGEIETDSSIAFSLRIHDSVQHVVDTTGYLDFEGKGNADAS